VDFLQVGIAHDPGSDAKQLANYETQDAKHENEDASMWFHKVPFVEEFEEDDIRTGSRSDRMSDNSGGMAKVKQTVSLRWCVPLKVRAIAALAN
jgi:hypothetical protein